jgi:hypothetical protein
MLYNVRTGNLLLGLVDLPHGRLVAASLEPSPHYASVADVIRQATDAFLHLGLFDSVAPMLPPISAETRRRRRALTRAARLQLTLVHANGEAAPTKFVNLLEAPADRRVVVLAGFSSPVASVGALLPMPTGSPGFPEPAA